MCYIFTARKNQILIVNDKQLEFLSGCILGDGSILKRGAIQIEQGEKQKEYLLWKYEQLKPLVSTKPIRLTRKNKNGTINSSYRFVLRQFFRPWRRKIYRNGKKVINDEILRNFSPLSLAIWYMDDGCLRSTSQVILCTDCFSKNSIRKLRKFLMDKWEIETRIKLKREPAINKVYQRLTIGSVSMVKFFDIIRSYIIPSMSYKILDPVTTRSIKRRVLK